ncbi:unnamed protein product [Brassica napus]|uniref:(rape) hypothetical protein n=1 Tax=Brassica napus TaxID=3708 RepID=A0A816QI25_BRANA|nr:unnamed protein product [Brassica napus]
MDSLKAKDLTQTDGPSPLLLAYKGGQGRRRYFKSAINRHINVNNFVQKDLDEMFPEWDKDVEDPVTYNIIKIERAFKDISDAISDGFGTCLREIKLLGDRMGAVEKMITKKGSSSDDIQLTTASNPPKPVHEPEVGTKTSPKIAEKRVTRQSVRKNDLPSDEPSVLILDKQVYTASDSLLEEARRQPKKETAMVNLREKSERERKLAPTQQTPFKGNITAKQIIPNKKVGRGYDPFAPYDKKKSKELTEWLEQDPCPSRFYHVLRTSLEWLTDHVSLLLFSYSYTQRYQDHPQHFRSERMCFLDHIFFRQHIVIWDIIIKHISPEELDEPYTYERQTVGVPQCRAGDCGPFTLKYIEYHSLGMEFPNAFCTRNGKTIREKMALDIFQELPMCHEWENQDNDENLGTYKLGYVNRVRIG